MTYPLYKIVMAGGKLDEVLNTLVNNQISLRSRSVGLTQKMVAEITGVRVQLVRCLLIELKRRGLVTRETWDYPATKRSLYRWKPTFMRTLDGGDEVWWWDDDSDPP